MSEFVLRRGLQNLVIAEVLTDTAEEITFGEVKKLIPAGEMSKTVDNEQAQYWFDNTVFATVGREGATEITVSGAGLRAAARAYLNGKHVDEATGAVLDSGQLTEKYFAFGGESKGTDGSIEMFWFAKGTFSVPDETDKTEDESTDANGTELTYSAIPTNHRFDVGGKSVPHKRTVIDTSETKVKAEQDFFAQPVTPDNIATICEKVTA